MRDALFPRGCAGCDRPDEVLCGDCRSLFTNWRSRELVSHGTAQTWSASTYQGVVRHAILAWKDHDDTELDTVFGEVMTSLLEHSAISVSCRQQTAVLVVPVPSSRTSIRRRGRRHIDPLAKAVANALCGHGLDAKPYRALTSIASGGRSVQQASSAQRAQRIGGRIALGSDALMQGQQVVLVDDIITTGSTLRQCAQTCRQAGAEVIGAMTLTEAKRVV
jgi:ComF family protein